MRIEWAKDETCLNEWNVKKGMGKTNRFSGNAYVQLAMRREKGRERLQTVSWKGISGSRRRREKRGATEKGLP
jgi:hypothetical protein